MTKEERLRDGSIYRVIKYFNTVTRTRHKTSNVRNQDAVSMMLDLCDDDIYKIFSFIRENKTELSNTHDATNNYIVPAKDLFICKFQKTPVEPEKEEPEDFAELVEDDVDDFPLVVDAPTQAPQVVNPTFVYNCTPQPVKDVDVATLLSNIALTALSSVDNTMIQERVIDTAKNELDKYIKETYGVIEHKVNVVTPQGAMEMDGVLHNKFDLIYNLVNSNSNVYLTGPAGTGKSEICRQVAKAMDLPFYVSNAVTQEFKLTGYSDANGNYQPTSFYHAFKDGGIFLLDEMDASTPEVLTLLNGALANGYFDFPAPIGMVYAHKDFHCIAAGNTYGEGATYEYNARNQLDASCLDRFVAIDIDYDNNIEMACANNDRDLVRFVHNIREGAKKAGVKLVVSYRAIRQITKLTPIFSSKAELLKACIIKSLTIDDLNILKDSVRGCGEYTSAYDELISRM